MDASSRGILAISPDGRQIACSVGGGTARVLCRVQLTNGASWSLDDTIRYGAPEGIFRVPAGGGTPEPVIAIQPGVENAWGPQLQVDRDSKLFTLRPGDKPAIVEKRSPFSPDARWLAYMDSTEYPRVFVQPFPPTGALYQLSPDGGRAAVWSRDGRGLFYPRRVPRVDGG